MIEIQISGGNVPGADGLVLAGGDSTVEGLSITGFTNGLHFTDTTGGDLVAGDFIGVAPGGGGAGNSNDGVFIDGAPSVTVGGTTPAARDVISANSGTGIYSQGAADVLIQGDFIGTDPTGTHPMGNYQDVNLVDSPSPTIGGAAAKARNLIAASSIYGMQLNDSTGGLIQGNLIGTDVTGTLPIGNGWGGIESAQRRLLRHRRLHPRQPHLGQRRRHRPLTAPRTTSSPGNLIGTDITGTKALGNSGHGHQPQRLGRQHDRRHGPRRRQRHLGQRRRRHLHDLGDLRRQPDRGELHRHRHHRHPAPGQRRQRHRPVRRVGQHGRRNDAGRGQRHLRQRPGRDHHRFLPRQQRPDRGELHRH